MAQNTDYIEPVNITVMMINSDDIKSWSIPIRGYFGSTLFFSFFIFQVGYELSSLSYNLITDVTNFWSLDSTS